MNDRKGVAVASLRNFVDSDGLRKTRLRPRNDGMDLPPGEHELCLATDYTALQRRVAELADSYELAALELDSVAECKADRYQSAWMDSAATRIRALLSGDGECGTEEVG